GEQGIYKEKSHHGSPGPWAIVSLMVIPANKKRNLPSRGSPVLLQKKRTLHNERHGREAGWPRLSCTGKRWGTICFLGFAFAAGRRSRPAIAGRSTGCPGGGPCWPFRSASCLSLLD